MNALQTRAPIPTIAELAQLDQWVISKPVRRRGKFDKPPFSPILDDDHKKPWMCSHSEPSHWSCYDTARAALPGFSWLGFVFHESDCKPSPARPLNGSQAYIG